VTSPAAVVRVTGDIDLDVVADLRAGLENAAALRPYVIADLTGAGTIDSLGLGALVRGRGAARQRGGDLLLVAPSRFVQTVLRTMRLHTAFRTFGTVPQAITAAVAAPAEN
jgi:anti-sigma B factor antagonist